MVVQSYLCTACGVNPAPEPFNIRGECASCTIKQCRTCGVQTDHWALEGLHTLKPTQAWCEKCCLEEFEEHDLYRAYHSRYCKRCAWEESPEATSQWELDQEQD